MADLETAFMTNPVNFLRAYTLSPPDGSPGNVLHQWDVLNQGNIMSGASGALTSTVSLKSAGMAKQYATFVKHGLFPGCLTTRFSPAMPNPAPHPVRRSAVPMWWLPWESLALVRIKIPPVPSALVDPSEDDFPRFFMTAGINGCSVMIHGPSEAPTVYHAGITGKLARPADAFWLEQLSQAQGHLRTTGSHIHAVHKQDYMGDRPLVQRFEKWKNDGKAGGFRLEVSSSFGSLIGVRYGRHWSFYLQQNVYTQDVEILKRSDVEVSGKGALKSYQDKATGSVVERVNTTVPRKFGALTLGTKNQKTFLRRTNQSTSVIAVGEVYPTRSFNADFTGRIEVRS